MGLIWTAASRAFVFVIHAVMVALMVAEMKTPVGLGNREVIWRAFWVNIFESSNGLCSRNSEWAGRGWKKSGIQMDGWQGPCGWQLASGPAETILLSRDLDHHLIVDP